MAVLETPKKQGNTNELSVLVRYVQIHQTLKGLEATLDIIKDEAKEAVASLGGAVVVGSHRLTVEPSGGSAFKGAEAAKALGYATVEACLRAMLEAKGKDPRPFENVRGTRLACREA